MTIEIHKGGTNYKKKVVQILCILMDVLNLCVLLIFGSFSIGYDSLIIKALETNVNDYSLEEMYSTNKVGHHML